MKKLKTKMKRVKDSIGYLALSASIPLMMTAAHAQDSKPWEIYAQDIDANSGMGQRMGRMFGFVEYLYIGLLAGCALGGFGLMAYAVFNLANDDARGQGPSKLRCIIMLVCGALLLAMAAGWGAVEFL